MVHRAVPGECAVFGDFLGYNVASLVAGTLPFIATALFAKVGWMGPAVLFSLLGVVSTLCALKMRETAPAVAKEPVAVAQTVAGSLKYQ